MHWSVTRRVRLSQVAAGRCSQAQGQTLRYVCESQTTRGSRQSLTPKDAAAPPHVLVELKAAQSGLSCFQVREGCRLLVNWWYYNPGRTEEMWRKKEEEGGPVHPIVGLSV